MQRFAELDKGLAKKFDASFVDLNPGVVAVVTKAQAADPQVAKLLLPDRVHPDWLAHWVMAEALLKGWKAPALVSSVTMDAAAGKVAEAENAAVQRVEREKEALRWTETEGSLPLAFVRDNAKEALLLDLSDIEEQLNQEPLRVIGLDAGQYTLTIDGVTVGTFPSDALAKGINLADYPTPMRAQSQRVSWLVRDRDEAHYIHLRMAVRRADAGAQPGKADVMDAFESSLEDSIYEMAAPAPHVFEVKRVEEGR
jgi:hypothetical protein